MLGHGDRKIFGDKYGGTFDIKERHMQSKYTIKRVYMWFSCFLFAPSNVLHGHENRRYIQLACLERNVRIFLEFSTKIKHIPTSGIADTCNCKTFVLKYTTKKIAFWAVHIKMNQVSSIMWF